MPCRNYSWSFAIGRVILAQEPVEGRTCWAPNAAFWERTGRAYMLQVLEEIMGETTAARFRTEKVKDLAAKMERWFDRPLMLRYLDFGGKDESIDGLQQKKIAEWVPAALRLPDPLSYDPIADLDGGPKNLLDDDEEEDQENGENEFEEEDAPVAAE